MQHAEVMPSAFFLDAERVVNVQIDPECWRILRWSAPADNLFVSILIDNTFQTHAEAAKPTPEITERPM